MRWVVVFWSSRLELIKAGTVLQPRLQGRPEADQRRYLEGGTLINVPVPKQAWGSNCSSQLSPDVRGRSVVPEWLARPDSRACNQSCWAPSVSGGSVSRW